MKTVALEGTALAATELAAMARKEPVILTRRGNPVAAVSSISGSDWESLALAHNPEFVALIEASRRSYRERGGIGLAKIRKELGLVEAKRPTAGRRRSRAR